MNHHTLAIVALVMMPGACAAPMSTPVIDAATGGAERYAKDLWAAIAAGTVRRAFLKGLGVARSCS
ncbi:MAG: hypothetical protein ABI605_05835 [Rhizobacter sp.]